MDRRSVLRRTGMLGSALLAGCSSRDREETRSLHESSTESATTTATRKPTTESPTETTEATTESPDEPVDLGVVYIPFMGEKWNRCSSAGTPALGHYDDTYDTAVVDRQLEFLLDHGVSTLLFNFGEEGEDYRRFEAFLEADRAAEIDIECFYVVSQAMRRERDLERDFEFVREAFLSQPNYSTHDGRPVVTFWDVDYLAWGGTDQAKAVNDRIFEEWGSYEAFVGWIRDQLTVSGVEPYLVGDFHLHAIGGMPEEFDRLNRQFDAATNWTGKLRAGETVPWEEAREHVRVGYEATRDWAEANGMDFAPMVFPGFDDRHNSCWGADRHVLRSPDHLRELLGLADEYRTTDRVNVATFNDWMEGHQIEPGTFRGEDYGTAYLEVLQEFVSLG